MTEARALRKNTEFKKFVKDKIAKVKEQEFIDGNYVDYIWRSHIREERNFGRLICLLATFGLILEKWVIKQYGT